MNTKTKAEIVAEMIEDLGNPNRTTEISSATIERKWNKALDEFNKRVGRMELRVLTVNTAEQQYNLIQAFPSINYVYQVKGCYFYLGTSTQAADTATTIAEEIVTGTTAGFVMSASATYADGTQIETSATYYATGTLLASATYFPSATLISSATYYASGTIINPDYYDIDGILLVSATTDVDGTMIENEAVYSYPSGTMLTSASYYSTGTLITPDYYDANGGSGTMYASAVYADGSQIETPATYNIDGTLEDQPAVYADGTQEETPATYYATGTLLASATYFEQTYRYVDYDNENQVPIESFSTLYDDTALAFISNLENESNSQLYDRDFQFIEPDLLLLIPAPIASGTILVLLQTDYSFDTLPDVYEPIVTEYAMALCQEIIGNARARLNTPQRSGDLVKYASREKWSYQAAERGYKAFDNECNRINVRRMF